jgi:hypothetical protein
MDEEMEWRGEVGLMKTGLGVFRAASDLNDLTASRACLSWSDSMTSFENETLLLRLFL